MSILQMSKLRHRDGKQLVEAAADPGFQSRQSSHTPEPQLGYPGHHQGTSGQTKKSADRRWHEPSVHPGWDRGTPRTCLIY